jgi:hypothetical protein
MKSDNNTGTPLTVVNGGFPQKRIEDMADAIKAAIAPYRDRVTVAEAIGALELAKLDLYQEQKDTHGR